MFSTTHHSFLYLILFNYRGGYQIVLSNYSYSVLFNFINRFDDFLLF